MSAPDIDTCRFVAADYNSLDWWCSTHEDLIGIDDLTPTRADIFTLEQILGLVEKHKQEHRSTAAKEATK